MFISADNLFFKVLKSYYSYCQEPCKVWDSTLITSQNANLSLFHECWQKTRGSWVRNRTWLLMIEAVGSVWPSHLCDFSIFLKDEGKDSVGWLHPQWAEFTKEIWDWDILHLNSKQKEACFFCGWRCYLFTQSSLLQTQAWELGRIKYGQARTLISWHIQQEYAWIFRAVVDLLSQKLYVDVIGLSGLVLYAANLLNS